VNGIAGRKRAGRLALSWTGRAPDRWMIARLMRWAGLAMAPLSVLALPWSMAALAGLALAFMLLACGHDAEYRRVRLVLDGGWLSVEGDGPARRVRADAIERLHVAPAPGAWMTVHRVVARLDGGRALTLVELAEADQARLVERALDEELELDDPGTYAAAV